MEGISNGSSGIGIALAVGVKECCIEVFRDLLPVSWAGRLPFDERREVEGAWVGEDRS